MTMNATVLRRDGNDITISDKSGIPGYTILTQTGDDNNTTDMIIIRDNEIIELIDCLTEHLNKINGI